MIGAGATCPDGVYGEKSRVAIDTIARVMKAHQGIVGDSSCVRTVPKRPSSNPHRLGDLLGTVKPGNLDLIHVTVVSPGEGFGHWGLRNRVPRTVTVRGTQSSVVSAKVVLPYMVAAKRQGGAPGFGRGHRRRLDYVGIS